KPIEPVKLGFTYRSRVDLNFDDSDVRYIDASVTGGTVTRVRTNAVHVPLPPVISAGINWQINPDWAVEFVYDYTRWSEFQNLSAQFGSPLPALGGLVPIPGFAIPQRWKNTSTLRFGASYNLLENLQLRSGIDLDKTPIPSSTLSPAIPGADWLAVTAGIGY